MSNVWPKDLQPWPLSHDGDLCILASDEIAEHETWGVLKNYPGESQEMMTRFDNHPGEPTLTEYLSQRERELHQTSREVYEERINLGVAKEQARKDLPLSTYTEAYWKMDLGNLLHFLGLRMDAHAQLEIRTYANIIGYEIVAKLFPTVWQGFLDYRLNAMTLTALDQDVICRLNAYGSKAAWTVEMFMACQPDRWQSLARCRERDECLAKLQKLGLVAADG